MKDIKYVGLVIIKPTKKWKIRALFFKIDDKYEFLQQWLDESDDPIDTIIHKMRRVTGNDPEVISLEPIYTEKSDKHINYYCCTVLPLTIIDDVKFYDEAVWEDPRQLYLSLNTPDKKALLATMNWIKENNFQSLMITRNNLFSK